MLPNPDLSQPGENFHQYCVSVKIKIFEVKMEAKTYPAVLDGVCALKALIVFLVDLFRLRSEFISTESIVSKISKIVFGRHFH